MADNFTPRVKAILLENGCTFVRQGKGDLLEGKIAVDRDEHVELPRRESGQLSIIDRDPPQLPRRHGLMAGDVARQPPIDAFVEEDPHFTVSTRRSFAASRNSMTCSRVTDGKPARNSSIDSPAFK